MTNTDVENFRRILAGVSGKKVVVAGHMRPDGDCIASALALADMLRNAGAKEVVCIDQNPAPRLYLNFLYGENILPAAEFDATDFLVISVDCADYARINETFSRRFPKPYACIDHHASNNSDAQIRIVDAQASATAELITLLALASGTPISAKNANRLYMGICTDTRQFTTSSTRPQTFFAAQKLAEAGADLSWTAIQLYQRESFAKMKLLADFLSSIRTYLDGRVCMGVITKASYAKSGAKKEDSDGLVDFARSIDGVEIAAVLEDLDDGIKGSLRGKTNAYKLNAVAQSYGGGGHLAAAGFTAKNITMDALLEKLLKQFEQSLNDYGNSR